MGRITDELHASEDQEPATVLKAVDKLIQSNERMQQQLNSAEAKLETQAQQLVNHAVEARTDALTSVANRRAFDKAMNDACQAMAERGVPTTIMMIDIDRFKNLNDSYGHQAGDAVLRGVARLLRQRMPEGNLVTRYGGEEFAIVFPNATLEQVERIAEHARCAVGEGTFDFEGLSSARHGQRRAGRTAAGRNRGVGDRPLRRSPLRVQGPGTQLHPRAQRPACGARGPHPAGGDGTRPGERASRPSHDVGISSPDGLLVGRAPPDGRMESGGGSAVRAVRANR